MNEHDLQGFSESLDDLTSFTTQQMETIGHVIDGQNMEIDRLNGCDQDNRHLIKYVLKRTEKQMKKLEARFSVMEKRLAFHDKLISRLGKRHRGD
jgi:uncharacterized coiled-coil protein SlyX